MTLAAEKQMKHVGETKAIANHDHDLIHELSKRLDSIWRYDQYIANAEGKEQVREFWQQVKEQDQRIVEQLKKLVKDEIECGCF